MFKIAYCSDCGNCDCPKVTTDAFWFRCPAEDRVKKTTPAPQSPIDTSDYERAVELVEASLNAHRLARRAQLQTLDEYLERVRREDRPLTLAGAS